MDRYALSNVKQSDFKFRKQTTLSVCPIGVQAGDENRNVGVESLRSSSVGDPAPLSPPFFFISRTLEKPSKYRTCIQPLDIPHPRSCNARGLPQMSVFGPQSNACSDHGVPRLASTFWQRRIETQYIEKNMLTLLISQVSFPQA